MCVSFFPRRRELRMQKLMSYLLRTQNLKVLPSKPGVGQYIAIHATPTARDFFLANFNPSRPVTCIFFSKTSPEFFLCWLLFLTLLSVSHGSIDYCFNSRMQDIELTQNKTHRRHILDQTNNKFFFIYAKRKQHFSLEVIANTSCLILTAMQTPLQTV